MKTNEYKETWFFDSEDDIPYFSFKSCLVCEDYRDIVLDCSDDDITSIMNAVSLMSVLMYVSSSKFLHIKLRKMELYMRELLQTRRWIRLQTA